MSKGYDDIVSARKFIFEQMVKVSKGEISLEEGIVLHKLSSDLLEGYRIQVKAMEIMANSGLKNVSLEDVTKQLR